MDDFFQNLPKLQRNGEILGVTECSKQLVGQNKVALEKFGEEKTALVPTESDDGQTTVELIQENGVVKKIVIRCDCGREIVLECRYGSLTKVN